MLPIILGVFYLSLPATRAAPSSLQNSTLTPTASEFNLELWVYSQPHCNGGDYLPQASYFYQSDELLRSTCSGVGGTANSAILVASDDCWAATYASSDCSGHGTPLVKSREGAVGYPNCVNLPGGFAGYRVLCVPGDWNGWPPAGM